MRLMNSGREFGRLETCFVGSNSQFHRSFSPTDIGTKKTHVCRPMRKYKPDLNSLGFSPLSRLKSALNGFRISQRLSSLNRRMDFPVSSISITNLPSGFRIYYTIGTDMPYGSLYPRSWARPSSKHTDMVDVIQSVLDFLLSRHIWGLVII